MLRSFAALAVTTAAGDPEIMFIFGVREMVKGGAPTVLWDFDGTLAYQEGHFSGAMLQVLDEQEPGHGVKVEDIRSQLGDVFPWNHSDRPHPELSTPEAWWAVAEEIFVRVFQRVGIDRQRAGELAMLSHHHYIDPKGFRLFEDTIPALEYLSRRGWNHFILSNHIPELPQIVENLGLNRLIRKCISSANIGYEKPNPQAFRIALELAGNPRIVWMVGDNVAADVRGADALGIKSILVRNEQNDEVRYCARNLSEAACIIEPKDQSAENL